MDLRDSIAISASGLRAQALRMRIVAENMANADSVASTPGGQPYRRRMPAFAAEQASKAGPQPVAVTGILDDKSQFPRIHDPGNPAADAAGYVLKPNVSLSIEAADMKAAQRSYQANLNAIEAARGMTMRTIDLLK